MQLGSLAAGERSLVFEIEINKVLCVIFLFLILWLFFVLFSSVKLIVTF